MTSGAPRHPDEAASGARRPPVIAVSMGDPLGIGPEVIVKALADPALRRSARFVVRGLVEPMHYAADMAEIEPYWWRVQHDSDLVRDAMGHSVVVLDYDEFNSPGAPGFGVEGPRPTKAGGHASFVWVEHAIEDCKRGPGDPLRADAIVTAPISKAAWSMAGRGRYPGHTELLATRFNARRHAMMFIGPRLRVALATAHIPLNDIRNALTIGRVFDPIDLGAEACRMLGIDRPRIAVCGLNPHAGEAGHLGREEIDVITPALDALRARGIVIEGPVSADTAFLDTAGKADAVLAMYHDQGLPVIKYAGFGKAVNITLGLPIVRTSVDHGTALALAGTGRADPASLGVALRYAAELAGRGG